MTPARQIAALSLAALIAFAAAGVAETLWAAHVAAMMEKWQ